MYVSTKLLPVISLILNILFSESSIAHQLSNLHEICLKATDYSGCLDHHKQNQSTNPQSNQLRIYGPVRLNLDHKRKKHQYIIVPGFNEQNKRLYVAADCYRKVLNTTGKSQKWNDWQKADKEFELKLIHDLCS